MTELSNDDMLELLDWRIGSDVWRREWMRLHDAPPATGWVNPTDAWIEWARELVSRPENHSGYGRKSVARILTAAEALHPKGFLRPSLEQALLVVGSMTGESYEPAKVYIDHAVDNNVIRIGECDIWRPGMRSGSGRRYLCRLTLHGKSLIKPSSMPEPFPETAQEYAPVPAPFATPAPMPTTASFAPWRRSAAPWKQQAEKPAPKPSVQPRFAIGDDFVWSTPFVDQQVQKFFRSHWEEFLEAVKARIDEQTKESQFISSFGPKRISRWINQTLRVRDGHPNPCKPQNVNASATYEVLVKAFRRNAHEHLVVKQLRQGQSAEAQAILDALRPGGALRP